ncbi:MAG: hypothetical protein Rsou_0383 [Candidatus Ruthia sp. Asou_11_S2]|nr:hypothetical protein [Candidatus Ruthia sp. Asou_11_S2]
MSNSNTDHSKELRYKTAKAWNKANSVSLSIKFNKNNPDDMALLEKFKSIDAKSNKARLSILLNN